MSFEMRWSLVVQHIYATLKMYHLFICSCKVVTIFRGWLVRRARVRVT